MNRILFPTDFSAAANHAFIYALQLAKQTNATVITLHVFNRPDVRGSHMAVSLEELFKEMDLSVFQNYKHAIPVLHKMAKENGFGALDIKHVLEEGAVIDNILAVAKRDAVDAIVMGTTGDSGLKKWLLGSIAGEVLEHAPCPVLVVPEKAHFDGHLNRIAFTTNFQPEERKALDQVLAFAKIFDAEVYCINVDLAHTDFYTHKMEPLKAEFAENDKIGFYVLEGTDIREAITGFLKENAIDILSMVTHKRNFLQELLEYSKTKAMTYRGKTPVLSWPVTSL